MKRRARAFQSALGLRRAPTAGGTRVIVVLFSVCVAVELVLQAADLGLLGMPRLRSLTYENGAFWPGLMRDWHPNYPAQPWLMYLTHGFLHGGVFHLALNMITLWSLAIAVLERVNPARFLVVYFGAMLGGGAVYALLSTSAQPMVGASGALFGLAGALLAWLWEDQPNLRLALRFAGRAVLVLLAINVALHFLMSGQLAWQTHLGGFLAGWILGVALHPAPESAP